MKENQKRKIRLTDFNSMSYDCERYVGILTNKYLLHIDKNTKSRINL